MGAESFKFLRKRPRAHAGKTQALLAEKSLKNDWGGGKREREREEKKAGEKGYYPARESLKSFASRVISRPKLSSNYRQTIVATDLVFMPPRVYDVPKILHGSWFPSPECVHSHKEISILIVLFALAAVLCPVLRSGLPH